MLACTDLSVRANLTADMVDACHMAIKALEQEPFINKACVSEKQCEHDKNVVIGKIRAEITDWQTDIHDNEYDAETHDFVFERIYEIIDEYKAKIKPQESEEV